jgi:hypothetical protein
MLNLLCKTLPPFDDHPFDDHRCFLGLRAVSTTKLSVAPALAISNHLRPGKVSKNAADR